MVGGALGPALYNMTLEELMKEGGYLDIKDKEIDTKKGPNSISHTLWNSMFFCFYWEQSVWMNEPIDLSTNLLAHDENSSHFDSTTC